MKRKMLRFLQQQGLVRARRAWQVSVNRGVTAQCSSFGLRTRIDELTGCQAKSRKAIYKQNLSHADYFVPFRVVSLCTW